ncbi:MAG: cadmium-translocating P-type ATPase [Candidatus Azobacteroides sp.]|nr:cadmium-translocating P-type ATPase [Candidatus Azobacteroides sp.]
MSNIQKPTLSPISQQCGCSHSHSHGNRNQPVWRRYLPAIISFFLLITGLVLDHLLKSSLFTGYYRVIWYILAYLPVGLPVWKEAIASIRHKDFFNEFTLMTIATLGAFFIREYPEGVGVMLFYSVGELFQESAVTKAQGNIKALLDLRPDKATVRRGNIYETVSPETIAAGEVIQVKAGEKVSLDGELLSPVSSFDTSALTGESIPRTIWQGEQVLAGMLNMDKVVEINVLKRYEDSSLAGILHMVQNATERKAKTELLIRRFAKIYTPLVFFMALAITIIPWFFLSGYQFETWLYRALVFLVISCPCALVISVPLGYFGGIGAASHNGILFKGANFLDLMASLKTVIMDKTGTLTKGVFNVQQVVPVSPEKESFLEILIALESKSNHPVAKAIVRYGMENNIPVLPVEEASEIAGHGIYGRINNIQVLAGNSKLMQKYGVDYDKRIDHIPETSVIVAMDGKYAGYVTIADELKEDAQKAIEGMRQQGVEHIVLLSGDKSSIVREISEQLAINTAYGELLPEDKVTHIEAIKATAQGTTAFVGDGINDAPALALSDIGIAMGGMGADAAIEVADVVIQSDQPSKIPVAIRIARRTKQIVIQNIVMALGIKVVILVLATLGMVSMWAAVFADVGVALLAILNSVKILRQKF